MRSLRKSFDDMVKALHCHTEPSAKYPQRIKVLNSIYRYFATLNMTIVRHCENLIMSLRAKTSISEFLRGNPQNKRQIKSYGLPRKANALLAMTIKTALRAMKSAFAPHCHTERMRSIHEKTALSTSIYGFFVTLRMTMLALSFAFFLAPNLAFAEQSGWFVGMQAGVGKGEIETELDGTRQRYTNVQNNRYEFSKIQKQAKIDTSKNWVAGNVQVVERFPWDPTDGGVSWDSTNTNSYVKTLILNYIPGGRSYGWNSGNLALSYPELVKINDEFKGLNAGLLAGYKHFFSSQFGLRFYGLFDFSFYKNKEKAFYVKDKFQSYNANINVDVLYNFYDKDNKIFGIFAGASVGGAQYMSSKTRLATDIDLGLNFGFRFGFDKHHSIELFNRVGGLFANAQSYKENDIDYQSESLLYGSTTINNPQTIAVCPANETGCANGSSADKSNRYVATRTGYTERYIKDTDSASAGTGIRADSYKQPYKIGIRYIYSF